MGNKWITCVCVPVCVCVCVCVCGFLFFLSGESCPHFEEWCLKPHLTHTHTHVFWRDSRISAQTHSELNSRSHSFTTSSLSITDTVRQLQLFCSIFFMQLDLLRFRWSSFSQPWCSIMTMTKQGFHTSHHTQGQGMSLGAGFSTV